MIIQNVSQDVVIDGTWLDVSVTEPGSTGSPYSYDGGIFTDVTESAQTREWAFTPFPRFAGYENEITVDSEEGGIRLSRVKSRNASRQYRLDMSVSDGIIRHRFDGFATGGYGEYANEVIIGMLGVEGVEVAACNGAGNQWNRSCWGSSFDLSGAVVRSEYLSGWTKERGGFLITPRHVVCASHYPIGVGKKVRFVKKGVSAELDEVVERTLTAGHRFEQDTEYDNYIYLLDSDVPDGVNPFSFCPASGRAPAVMFGKLTDLVLATASDKSTLGSQGVDTRLSQFVIPGPNGALGTTYTTTGLEAWVADWIPSFAGYHSFIRPILAGDSGSPSLVIVDENTLAFNRISTTTTEASCNAAISAVDALAGVSTGYTVSVMPEPSP